MRKNSEYKNKTLAERGLQSTILIFMILMLTQISMVSAFEFDNVIEYSEKNLKVDIINSFGLGEDLGTATLKSHKSVNEVLNVPRGDDVLVMYYDLNFKEIYLNGLGDVIFINKTTNKEIKKQYKFKYLTTETYDVNDYKKVCSWNELNNSDSCENVLSGTHQEERNVWVDYNSKDIPQGEITLGLFTEVKKGDYIDGIWTIAGKELTLHAEWAESLNTNIIDYWKLEEDGTDYINEIASGNNCSLSGTPTRVTGFIDYGQDFTGNGAETGDYADCGSSPISTTFSVNFWFRPDALTNNYRIIDNWDYTTGGWRISGASASSIKFELLSGTSEDSITGTGITADSDWYMITGIRHANNTAEVYINGVQNNHLDNSEMISSADNLGICGISDTTNNPGYYGFNGKIDEIGIWERALSPSEVSDLYNSGSGIQYTDEFPSNPPVVTLNSPANNSDILIQSTNFNCLVYDDVNLTNVSLYINGVLNETNSSGVNNSNYTFSKIFTTGEYNWTCSATDNESQTTTADERYFNVTLSPPTINLISPVNNTNHTTASIDFICEAYDDIDLVNVSFYLNENLNETNSSGVNNSNYTFSKVLVDGDYNWTCDGYDNVDLKTTANERYLIVDTTYPNITIIYPVNNTTYTDGYVNSTTKEITLNWTTSDTHLDTCWYYNGTANTTLSCGDNATINISYGLYNFKFYANDTFEFLTEEDATATWIYSVLENNLTYNNETSELSSETFTLNVSYNSSKWTSITGYLNYNGTNYTSTLGGSGNTRTFSKLLSIPAVTTNTNKTFYWIIRLTNSTGTYFFESGEYTQLVNDILIDNCSAYTTTLYNLYLRDEETQDLINGTIEVDLSIYGEGGNDNDIEYYTKFSNLNTTEVCINSNLTEQNLYLDTKIKYYAPTHQTEYYNVVKYLLNSSSVTQNITLYDLNTSSATVFDIVYKGQNLRPVDDALIDITREYVAEGTFKTVERPITDIDGKTTASLIKDVGIYTFYVYKNGILLSTFQKVTPICNNDLTEDCTINLNAVSTTIQIDEFSQSDDLNYIVTWDEDTKEVELTFSTISSASSTINLTAYLFDQNINETICSSAVTSSSGSLTCLIPDSYTNQTAVVQIFKDNDIVDIYYISLHSDPFDYFGYTGYFLAFIIIMTIPLMFVTSLIGVVIGMMVGVVMLGLLFLTTGAGLYSLTGGMIWFIVSGAILIWKLNQTERR